MCIVEQVIYFVYLIFNCLLVCMANTISNWEKEFTGFPKIPYVKLWQENNNTLEQTIFKKVIEYKHITREEEIHLYNVLEFYNSVFNRLRLLDVSSLSPIELQKFMGYYKYIFNNYILSKNELTASRLIRLVRNEAIIGSNELLTRRNQLSYPSKEIVKQVNRYNRANTPNSTVFYAADSINAALKETKPKVGERVTIGFWDNCTARPLVNFPISHNDSALKVNPDVKQGYNAFARLRGSNHFLVYDIMKKILTFLSDEYAKQAKSHFDYFNSAVYSEEILGGRDTLGWDIECISYPSVQNEYKYLNVAIKPNILDLKFKLAKVISFVVTREMYERSIVAWHPEDILFVHYDGYKETSNVLGDGTIVWS